MFCSMLCNRICVALMAFWMANVSYAQSRSLKQDSNKQYRVHQQTDDFVWGGTPNDQTWHASIHELVDRRGNVIYRYLHVEGTSDGEGLRVRAVNHPKSDTEYLIVEIDTDGDFEPDGESYSFPEYTLNEIDDIRMFGLAGDDHLQNQTSIPDILFGGLGDDHVYGGSGPSILFGQDGDDTMDGGDGNDLVLGEEGSDRIVGGAGSDELVGGPGADNLSGSEFPWNQPATFDDGSTDFLSGGSDGDVFYRSSNEDQITDFGAGDSEES